MSATPTQTGYADVNGLHLYYETYGSGRAAGAAARRDADHRPQLRDADPDPGTTHTVIGVEMQGHGRTANIDREITYPNLASDVVALLDHLGIDRAAVLGHSMGAGVALELAVSHPDRVSAIVPISASVSKDGMHPDLSDPSTFETSPIMPTAQDFADFKEAYQRLSRTRAVRRVPHVAERDGQRLRRLDGRAARRHHLPGAHRPGRHGLHPHRARRR